MVPDPGLPAGVQGGLDEHEIEPQRKVWKRLAVREAAAVEQPERGIAHPAALAPVERLLRQPEVAAHPPADLDSDQGRGRSRVDRDDVQLVAADVDVSAEDRPAERLEASDDEVLRGVAGVLGLRSRHPVMIVSGASLAINPTGFHSG